MHPHWAVIFGEIPVYVLVFCVVAFTGALIKAIGRIGGKQ